MELLATDSSLGGFSFAAHNQKLSDALASAHFTQLVDAALTQHGILPEPLESTQPTSPDTPYSTAREELTAMALAALQAPLTNVTGTPFQLADLTPAACRAEMEFHVTEATSMLGDDPHVPVNRRGLLNGFIDLLFEHDNRYYILDWKTNTLDDYAPPSVQRAMEEADYLLQYRIYGLALMRWLETCGISPDHFGGVYYLFVRGAMQPGGIGVHQELWNPAKRTQWQQFVSQRLRPNTHGHEEVYP
jgi:ATP-dependent exoDNAse (exonuclease V) beta subunit